MNSNKRRIIKSYLKNYLEVEFPNLDIKFNKNFKCPFCDEHDKDNGKNTAVVYSDNPTLFCFHPPHKNFGDIFKVAKKIEGLEDLDDESIAELLIDKLDIKIGEDETDKLLKRYHEAGFALFPCISGHKNPKMNKKPIISEWEKSNNKNLEEWHQWVDNGSNLALNLGKVSNVIAIDIDADETYEKVKHLLGDTLSQSTKRGRHFLYNYDPDFLKTINKNFRNAGFDMELRTDGAYIIIAPSSVDGEVREWNDSKISDMPKELKDFCLKHQTAVEKNDPALEEAINNTDLSDINLGGLEGCCNDTFIRYGGILRKKMNTEGVTHALYHLNSMLKNPMDKKTMRSIIAQIDKYNKYDKQEMADIILDRLEIIEETTAFKLAMTLKYEQKDVEEVLKYLLDQEKVMKEGDKYCRTQKPNWRTDFMNIEKPSPFPVPFFDDVSYFKNGSMLIIGACTGTGKTTLVGNILKFYKDKSIVPDLLSSEKTSGIGDVACKLGLVEGDFRIFNSKRLQNIELDDNRVTVIDWLRPIESQYFKMDQIFENLDVQANKHGGLLIVFVQLRTSNRQWYAMDLIEHNGYLNAKYLHSEIKDSNGKVTGYDRQNTYFDISKMRKPKNKINPTRIIPMKYNPDTEIISKRR